MSSQDRPLMLVSRFSSFSTCSNHSLKRHTNKTSKEKKSKRQSIIAWFTKASTVSSRSTIAPSQLDPNVLSLTSPIQRSPLNPLRQKRDSLLLPTPRIRAVDKHIARNNAKAVKRLSLSGDEQHLSSVLWRYSDATMISNGSSSTTTSKRDSTVSSSLDHGPEPRTISRTTKRFVNR